MAAEKDVGGEVGVEDLAPLSPKAEGETPKNNRLAPPYPARTILDRRRKVALTSAFVRLGGSGLVTGSFAMKLWYKDI
jgi:hypothetical protein